MSDQKFSQSASQSQARPQTATPSSLQRRMVGIGLCGLAVLSIGGLVWKMSPKRASVDELNRIYDAFRSQPLHVRITEISAPTGKLRLSEKLWFKGAKFLATDEDSSANQLCVGFDGKEGFRYSSSYRGYIDTEWIVPPPDDILKVLKRPKFEWTKFRTSLRIGEVTPELYVGRYKSAKYECYVDPQTWLPMRWDVKNEDDELVQSRTYEYPADLPDIAFAPPRNRKPPLIDYPVLRGKLIAELQSTKVQTQEVLGRKISLVGLIAGRHQLVGLLTASGLPNEAIRVEFANAPAPALPSSLYVKGMVVQVSRLEQVAHAVSSNREPVRFISGGKPDFNPSPPYKIRLQVRSQHRTPTSTKESILGYVEFQVAHPIQIDEEFDAETTKVMVGSGTIVGPPPTQHPIIGEGGALSAAPGGVGR